MYCEFGADSCLVIKNIPEFQNRFNEALKKHNKKTKEIKIPKIITCPIIYYDPFNISPPSVAEEIILTKPFRFAYQHEYRLVALPTRPQPLEAFFLNLGSLKDIAELACDG
jgi:hypothetical protein